MEYVGVACARVKGDSVGVRLSPITSSDVPACRALHDHPPQPAVSREPVGRGPLGALGRRSPQSRVTSSAMTGPWSGPTSPTTRSDRSNGHPRAVLQPRGVVRPRRPSPPRHTPADPTARPEGLPLHRLLAERQRRRAQPTAEVHRPRHHDDAGRECPPPARRGDMRVTAMPDALLETLSSGEELALYRDHQQAAAAKHLVVRTPASTATSCSGATPARSPRVRVDRSMSATPSSSAPPLGQVAAVT